MNEHSEIQIIRVTAAAFLTLAIVAMFATVSLIAGLNFTLRLVEYSLIQIFIGFAAMLLFCIFLAPTLGMTSVKYPAIGGFCGVVVLFIGTVFGTSSSLFLYGSTSFFDFVAKPLYAVMLYGSIPAFVIGLAGALLVRWVQRK